MAVSALIPNFNYEGYVQEAIESVLQQTHPVSHIYIADDGSTDGSVAKIEDMIRGRSQITLIRHPKNLGFYQTIEELISCVKTEYLMVVPSDDYVMPNFCEQHLRCFRKNPDIALSCSVPGLFQGTIPQQPVHLREAVEIFSPTELADLIATHPFWIACNTSLHRTAAVREFGGFKPGAQFHNDWIMNYSIGFKYGIGFVPQSLAIARVHSHSMSATYAKTEDKMFPVYDFIMQEIHQDSKRAELFKRSGILNDLGHRIQSYIRKTPAYWGFFPSMQKRRVRLKWNRWKSQLTHKPEIYKTMYFNNVESIL